MIYLFKHSRQLTAITHLEMNKQWKLYVYEQSICFFLILIIYTIKSFKLLPKKIAHENTKSIVCTFVFKISFLENKVLKIKVEDFVV